MLAYILAVLVGTGSVGLYIAAFFFPEIHRKHDFIWSGVGCFYALALWIYARQETGGILIGQTASVALLGWFAWQTINLRRQLGSVDRQTSLPNAAKIPNRSDRKQSIRDANQPPADRQHVPAKATTAAKPDTTATSSPSKSPSERPPASAKNTPVVNPPQQPANPTSGRQIVTITSSPSTSPSDRPPASAQTTPVATPMQPPATPIPPTAKPATTVTPAPNTVPPDRPPTIAKTVPATPPPQPSNPTPTPAKPAVAATSTPSPSPTEQPPTSAKIAAVERNISPQTPSGSNPSSSEHSPQYNAANTPVEPQAWIKMEVKPSAASKPLGNPAQPPAAPPPTASQPKDSSSPQIAPESISPHNVPSDAIQTTAKLEEESDENWE